MLAFASIARAEGKTAPGLALTIEPIGATAQPDTREVRLVALHVPAGASPSAFVPPGRFRATWAGELNLKIRERYSFSAEGRGKLTVRIDDKTVLEAAGDDLAKMVGEPVRLRKGANKLVAVYESPETGEATVRLLWSQKGVPAQPPRPDVYTHDADAPATARGRLLRDGRRLVAELRCTKCHAGPAGNAYPELGMDAPSFADIGARLNEAWMAAWVADPRALRADARMPKVFHAGNRPDGIAVDTDTRAADAAAYLATLGKPDEPAADVPAADPKRVAAGERLYVALACAACHTPPGAAEPVAHPPRVSHEFVAAKFKPAGLRRYLLNPSEHYAWNPMPDFRLTDDEAGHLAAYLLAAGDKAPPAAAVQAPGDAGRGRRQVEAMGCASCHAGTEEPGKLGAAPIGEMKPGAWSQGCMAPEGDPAHRAAPVFSLTDGERSAIRAFAETDRSALARDEPGEFAERQYAALRCGNCHARDDAEPALTTTLAAEYGRAYSKVFGDAAEVGEAGENGVHLAPDQRAFPRLTWAGEKLRPEWARAFIAGEVAYKPRPYLRARMPAFKRFAGGLATGFATSHGVAPATDPHPAPDASLAPVGLKLVGAAGGFSCVQCHSARGAPPLAPFEAPAIDFAHVAERLRKDYYHRWMDNPLALDPTTKMPRFSDDDGTTALRETLDGDARRQFEAIWQYLLQGKDVQRAQ